jgi:hypothetical protein
MSRRSLTRACRSLTALAVFAGSIVAVQVFTAVPSHAAISNIGIYFRDSPRNTQQTTKSVTAECPAGQQVLGGGGRLFFADNNVILAVMFPFNGTTVDTYTAAAVARPGVTASWYVRAYIVCGDDPTHDVEITQAAVTNDSPSGSKVITSQCSGAKVPIGTGAAIGGAAGGVGLMGAWPSEIGIRGVTARGQDDLNDGLTPPRNWLLTAWAVCATKNNGYEIVNDFSDNDSRDGIGTSVLCPPGKSVLGEGAFIIDSTDNAHLYSLWPRSTATAEQGVVDAKRSVSSGTNWTIQVFAVCAVDPT